jgi:acid phosphatase (class A)
MMKKIILLMFAIMMVTLGAFAQKSESKEGGDISHNRFLTDEVCLQCAFSLPQPPSDTSKVFANDIKYYKLGKEERERKNIREEVLREDETSIFALFSGVLGMKVSKEHTPEIYKLAKTVINDALFAAHKGQERFKRTKPYVYFHEELLTSKGDGNDVKDKENSYPSSHSTRGWILALVLGIIAQEHSEALMKCAEQYATYQVIMGRHWKSDIDAGRTLAITIFSKEVVSPKYQQQQLKAKEEYKSLR